MVAAATYSARMYTVSIHHVFVYQARVGLRANTNAARRAARRSDSSSVMPYASAMLTGAMMTWMILSPNMLPNSIRDHAIR
jgi:di/tricarboxylate transporter